MGSAEAEACPAEGATFSCPGNTTKPIQNPFPPPPSPRLPDATEATFVSCNPGQERDGSGGCRPCSDGHYCLGGDPIVCPRDKWWIRELDMQPITQGSESSCSDCPMARVGTECTNGYSMELHRGFWMAKAWRTLEDGRATSSIALRCAWYNACVGSIGESDGLVNRYAPNKTKLFGDELCKLGHKGLLCGRCDSTQTGDPESFYRGRRECLACGNYAADAKLDMSQTIMVLAPIFTLTFLLVALYLEPPARLSEGMSGCMSWSKSFSLGRRVQGYLLPLLSGLTKICLSYAQCLGAIGRFSRVRWPQIFVDFMNLLDELNLELFSIVPAECLAGQRLGYYFEMLAVLVAPIGLVWSAFSTILLMRWLAGRFWFRPQMKAWCCWPKCIMWRLRDETRGWPGLKKAWNTPPVYKLLTWTALIMYPSISRKTLSIFDCVYAGREDEQGVDLGADIFLLREDPVYPEGQCFTTRWWIWVSVASVGLLFYCLGLPLGALYLASRYHYHGKHSDFDKDERERVTLLVSTYEERYWYCESLSLLHRFFFTGLIHLTWPETRVQIWVGVLASLFVYVNFQLSLPYHFDLCDTVQSAAFLQILLTYISAFLFFDDAANGELAELQGWLGSLLVLINCSCFIVMVGGGYVRMYRARRNIGLRRLRYAKSGQSALPRPLAPGQQYHIFLSHVWGTGQDQVRIIKERLLETFPPSSLEIFLDVDEPDLQIGALEEYIDNSDAVLILATHGYFQSKNCMRELRRAVSAKKQIICVIEPETKKGGLTLSEIKEQLGSHIELKLSNESVPELVPPNKRTGVAPPCMVDEWHVAPGELVSNGASLCTLEWSPNGRPPYQKLEVVAPFDRLSGKNLLGEERPPAGMVLSCASEAGQYMQYGAPLLQWADPDGVVLAEALLEQPPIEWNRIGVFQEITIRLIAQRLLPLHVAPIKQRKRRLGRPVGVSAVAGRASGRQKNENAPREAPANASAPVTSSELEAGGAEWDDILARASESRNGRGHAVSSEETYTNGERRLTKMEPPPAVSQNKRFHLFVSAHNAGALELVDEVRGAFGEGSIRTFARMAAKGNIRLPNRLSRASRDVTRVSRVTNALRASHGDPATDGSLPSPPPSPPLPPPPPPPQPPPPPPPPEKSVSHKRLRSKADKMVRGAMPSTKQLGKQRSFWNDGFGGDRTGLSDRPKRMNCRTAAAVTVAMTPAKKANEFTVTFKGRTPMGMALRDFDPQGDAAAMRPPAGYSAVVGYLQPGSVASKMGLTVGAAVLSINDESVKDKECKDVMRLLNAAKHDDRRVTFTAVDVDTPAAPPVEGAPSASAPAMAIVRKVVSTPAGLKWAPAESGADDVPPIGAPAPLRKFKRHETNAFSSSMRDRFLKKRSALTVTDEPRLMRECETMLVYLTSRTWSVGEQSAAFGRQVANALANGIPLLLVHEMPAVGDVPDEGDEGGAGDGRYGCEFGTFFGPDQTPRALLNAGIYHTVAVPLKGGAFREMSLALLVRKISEKARMLKRAPKTQSRDLRVVVNALRDTLSKEMMDAQLADSAPKPKPGEEPPAPPPAAATPPPPAPPREFTVTFKGRTPMGMALRDFDPQGDAAAMRPPAGYSAVVGYLQPGSVASKMGLTVGAAVLSINDESVKDKECKDVMRLLNAAKHDDRRVTFLSGGTPETLPPTVLPAPVAPLADPEPSLAPAPASAPSRGEEPAGEPVSPWASIGNAAANALETLRDSTRARRSERDSTVGRFPGLKQDADLLA